MNVRDTNFEAIDHIELSLRYGFCKHGNRPSEFIKVRDSLAGLVSIKISREK
jgi:hypothetical protein